MPVVDLTAQRGACDVTIHAASLRPDPANDALVYKLDLLMLLASRAEAELVEKVLPGLGETFDRAGEQDNWKGSQSARPAESLRVVLTAKEAGEGQRQGPVSAGGVIIQGTAELKEVKASLSKRQRAVLVRLSFHGHGEDVAAKIAGNLSRSVGMSFERAQGVLPFATTARPTPALREGMIVAAGIGEAQIVGRITEIDGDAVAVQVDGTEVTVDRADVISSFAFAADGETSAALSDYAERCERRKVPVSWRALVEALAARGATEGTIPVTADDVEQATRTVEAQAGQPSTEEEPTQAQPMAEVVEIAPTKRTPRARANA